MAVEWLKAAKLDIENISYIIEVEHLTPICAFHSQQAIEKTLKALIASKDIDIPKIHSLNRLFEICKEQIQNNKPDMVNLLDSLYVESRYPGDIGLLPYGDDNGFPFGRTRFCGDPNYRLTFLAL